MGLESVVEVRCVVRNLVHEVNQLRFERRPLVEQILSQLREFPGGVIARMLYDPFANLKGQVQSGEIKISLLELLHNAQGVQIMVKPPAMFPHSRIKLLLARVAERGVPDVVDESQRLRQIGVQSQ